MIELTPEQLSFLEKYVLRRSISLAGLDLAQQQAQAEAIEDELARDIATLKQLIAQYGPPDGSDAGERSELDGFQGQALGHLIPPVTRADLKLAAQIVQKMRKAHDLAERRIARDAIIDGAATQEARAIALIAEDTKALADTLAALRGALSDSHPARPVLDTGQADLQQLSDFVTAALARAESDRQARIARAAAIRQEIKSLKVPNADPAETGSLDEIAAKVTLGWSDPPEHQELDDADPTLGDLRRESRDVADALARREAEITALRQEAQQADVDGADSQESAQIAALKTPFLSGLPLHPTIKQVEQAENGIAAIRELIATVSANVSARKLRRDQILIAQDMADIAGATAVEKARLQEVLAKFPDLSAVPSQADLKTAEAALTELTACAEDIRSNVSDRVEFAASVATLLDGIAWGKALLPHTDAPETLMAPIKAGAEAMQTSRHNLRDAAQADSWPEISDRAAFLGTIRSDCDAITAELTAANAAVTEVQDKLKNVRDRIDDAHIHKMSAQQQQAFNDQADRAAALLQTSPDEQTAAVTALDQLYSQIGGFQSALAALTRRASAVDLTPAGASNAEKAVLDKLHKAALAAIEKALP